MVGAGWTVGSAIGSSTERETRAAWAAARAAEANVGTGEIGMPAKLEEGSGGELNRWDGEGGGGGELESKEWGMEGVVGR